MRGRGKGEWVRLVGWELWVGGWVGGLGRGGGGGGVGPVDKIVWDVPLHNIWDVAMISSASPIEDISKSKVGFELPTPSGMCPSITSGTGQGIINNGYRKCIRDGSCVANIT